ncbi:hypothetical protein EON66_05825 [archaeon]|nr:MAG: hypothetical protein EON66_05825 [archaeon]
MLGRPIAALQRAFLRIVRTRARACLRVIVTPNGAPPPCISCDATYCVDTCVCVCVCVRLCSCARLQNQECGLNVCGEGGEYETFVLDAPFFAERLVLDETLVERVGGDALAPVAHLNIRRCHTEPKEEVAAWVPGTALDAEFPAPTALPTPQALAVMPSPALSDAFLPFSHFLRDEHLAERLSSQLQHAAAMRQPITLPALCVSDLQPAQLDSTSHSGVDMRVSLGPHRPVCCRPLARWWPRSRRQLRAKRTRCCKRCRRCCATHSSPDTAQAATGWASEQACTLRTQCL